MGRDLLMASKEGILICKSKQQKEQDSTSGMTVYRLEAQKPATMTPLGWKQNQPFGREKLEE